MADHGLVVGSTAALPDWLVVLAAVLTQLGDAWFMYLGLGLLYWLGDRRLAANPRSVGATLVAVALGALAVTVGLKSLFAVPRPPGAGAASAPAWIPAVAVGVFESAATGDGFAFPSGHAVGSTMVYGGLALFLDVGRRRTRLVAAGGIIGVVAATRVVLGVHYLVDVLAGVLVGAVTLWAFARVSRSGFRPRPDRPFFLAGVLGVAALAVALVGGHGEEALEAGIALGGGFGGYAVWRVRGTETAPVETLETVVGLGVMALLFGTAAGVTAVGLPYVFGVVPDTTPFRLLAVVPLSFAAVALIIAWPTLVARVRETRTEEPDVSALIREAEPGEANASDETADDKPAGDVRDGNEHTKQ